jgi:hypothetical protein
MKHTNKQLIIDFAEWNEVQDELAALKKPADTEALTEEERQEATGILLVRAIQNPTLFRGDLTEVNLGKYKAIFVQLKAFIATSSDTSKLLIRFVRT